MPKGDLFLTKYYGGDKPTTKYLNISCTAIEKGLFSTLPSSVFMLYLILFSRLDEASKGKTTWEEITEMSGLNKADTSQSLIHLAKAGLLTYDEKKDHIVYAIAPQALPALTAQSRKQNIDVLEQEERFLQELLSGRPVSEQELVKGLVMILAPKKLTPSLRSEIEEIMNIFSPEMVKELIRRIKKAMDDNPHLQPLPYLRAIVKDWLEADLSTRDDLKRADRLYRETYELAQAFGLKGAYKLAPSHKETLLAWITQKDADDFALSVEVAKMAIEEAIRRKRDGRPSLDYIERNFILPWKKARLASPDDVAQFLAGNKTRAGKKEKKETNKDWQYEKFLDT